MQMLFLLKKFIL